VRRLRDRVHRLAGSPEHEPDAVLLAVIVTLLAGEANLF
jgi:hypothetical protein